MEDCTEEAVLKIFGSCIKDDIEYYLNPNWYELVLSSYIEGYVDGTIGISLCVNGLPLTLEAKLGYLTSEYWSEEDKVPLKFLHMRDSELKLIINAHAVVERVIPVLDRKIKSSVVKYLRIELQHYYERVIGIRCSDPEYQMYDGSECIGHRG